MEAQATAATDATMIEIEKQTRAAWDAGDMARCNLYADIGRELAHLRAVGRVAAKIYEDHSDQDAWMELFVVLSDAGLL